MSVLKLSPNDNVVLATTELKKGETITADGKKIVLLNDIPNAHKIAIKDFAEGEEVIKYDNVIGYAKTAIKTGEWVHTHNLQDITEELCNRYAEEFRKKVGGTV